MSNCFKQAFYSNELHDVQIVLTQKTKQSLVLWETYRASEGKLIETAEFSCFEKALRVLMDYDQAPPGCVPCFGQTLHGLPDLACHVFGHGGVSDDV